MRRSNIKTFFFNLRKKNIYVLGDNFIKSSSVLEKCIFNYKKIKAVLLEIPSAEHLIGFFSLRSNCVCTKLKQKCLV